MGRILLIVCLLVAYGSLYPFDFHSRHLAASPVWLLFHSWPPAFDRSVLVDIVLNVLIYLPVGLFGSLSRGKTRAILLAAALSASVEMLQLFDDSRLCSTLDLISNVAGAAAGAGLARLYGSRVARLLTESPMRASLRPSPALLLLCCWIGYQLFPFIPYLRLYPVRMKISALLHPGPFSMVQMTGAIFEWLAVARLLEEIQLGVGTLLILMMLLPARLLIAGRTFSWAELAGTVCAGALWTIWLARDRRRTRWLAWMAVVVLLLRGLAPFHWQSSAAPFSWSPFGAFFGSEKNSAAAVFFDKSFLYGTVVWFFSQGRFSPLVAGLGVALLLGAIEVVQTHLAGRTPEITDPLYCLIVAAVIKLLDAADRGARSAKMRFF